MPPISREKPKMKRYFTETLQASSASVEEGQVNIFTPDLNKFKAGDFKRDKMKLEKKLLSGVKDLDRSQWDVSGEGGGTKRMKEKSQQPSKKKKKPSFREDPYPGDAPIQREKVKHYIRGKGSNVAGMKTKYHRSMQQTRENKIQNAARQAARAELLRQEEAGFLEAPETESTRDIRQHDIAASVDISSAQKHFELDLNKFGPYKLNYTRNGRFLLLAGKKGHVAALDWQTKNLMCEMNVMETCKDVRWLHNETMFAVAQKTWTYVYDNRGIELHCLKLLDKTLRLEFLPYHFLLVASSEKGFLTYIDVSLGKKVAAVQTKMGRLDVMCQNPRNAIIHLGHSGGTVSLWSPSVKEPLVKMLCHVTNTRAIAVDPSGNYMATSGAESLVKIWDLRTYRTLQSCRVPRGASHLAFSQQGLLAASLGNIVQVYKDCQKGDSIVNPYLSHKVLGTIEGLQFCPYEDVLGVSHGRGFTSMLVPGAGEANFDALEANPFQTKKQRQEAEVKMLLDKIQPDMINLDTSMLGKVDHTTTEQVMQEKVQQLEKKVDKSSFTPRHKMKGKSTAQKMQQRKQNVRLERKLGRVREMRQEDGDSSGDDEPASRSRGPYNVFDRFKKKNS